MNNHKYYKVVEIETKDYGVCYEVHACDNWVEWVLNHWVVYTKNNTTIGEAKKHIHYLISVKIISTKTVFNRVIK